MKNLPISAAVAAVLISGFANAATINKANNADNLDLTTSWNGGVVPSTNDVAVWDSTVSAGVTNALGSNLTFGGVLISNVGGPVRLSAGNTLTLGNSGVDMTAASQDLTIVSSLALLGGAGQTWKVATGRQLISSAFTAGAGSFLLFDRTAGLGSLIASPTLSNGIVGPWAVVRNPGTAATGSTNGYTYATVSGSAVVAYTGATVQADLNGTLSATANYDLTGTNNTANRGANPSINTARLVASTGTNAYNTQYSYSINGANGFLTAGGATMLIGGVGSIRPSIAGGNMSLIAQAGPIVVSCPILNNTSASSVSVAGTNTVTFSGVNTYTGPTYVAGTLILSGAAAVNGSSAIILNAPGAKLRHSSSAAISAPVTVTRGTIEGTGTLGAVTVDSPYGVISNGVASSSALTVGTLAFSNRGVFSLSASGVTVPLVITGALTTTPSNGVVTVNAAAGGWVNGTNNLVSFGSFAGSASDFAVGTVAGLNARQAASGLVLNGNNLAVVISGIDPVWTGATSGAWTTNVIGGFGNWQTNGAPTEFITADNVLFSDSATGTTAVDVSAANVVPGNVTFSNSILNYTVSSSGGFGIGGSGALAKSGAGTVTLATSNSFTGAAAVSGGRLNLSNAYALGGKTSLVLGDGGSIDNISGAPITTTAALNTSISGNVGLGAGSISLNSGSLTVSSNSALTMGGGNLTVSDISGTGALVASGSGTLTSTGLGVVRASSLTVTGPSLQVSTNPVQLGYKTGNGTLTLNSGAFSSASEIRIGTSDIGGATETAQGFMVVNGGTANVSSITLGRGINNLNAVGGTLTANGGTVNNTNDLVLGYAGNGSVTMNVAGGTVNVGPAAVKWLIMSYYDTMSANINISSGSLRLLNNSAIKFSRGNTNTSTTNTITQTGGDLTFYSDAGTNAGGTGNIDLQYSGAAACSNTYNLNGGTLTANTIVSSLATATRTFNFNGGTLVAGSSAVALMNLGAGNARANVRDGGAKINTAGKSVTLPQALVHSDVAGDAATDGGLTKSGNGTLVLTASNSYTGPTAVTGGTLQVDAAGYVPTAIAASNGTLVLNGAAAGAVTLDSGASISGAGTAAGQLTINSGANALVDANGSYVTANGVSITGPVAVSFINGVPINGVPYTVFGYGAGSVSGTNNLYAPYRLIVTDDTINKVIQVTATTLDLVWNSGSGVWTNAGGTNWVGGAQFYAGDNVTFTNSPSDSIVTVEGQVLPGLITIDATNNYTFSGSGSIAGAASLTKSGSGTLSMSGSNSFTGGMTIAGGHLNINAPHALGAGTLTLAAGTVFDNKSGGSLTMTANNGQVWDGDITFAGTDDLFMGNGTVTLAGTNTNVVVTLANGKTLGVGKIVSAVGGLRVTGSGTLATLAPGDQPGGNTSIVGPLEVDSGVLLNINLGSTIATTADWSVGGLAGAGTIVNGSSVTRWLFVNAATDSTFSGTLRDGTNGGRLGLNKTGTGTLALTGTNNFTDPFNVNGGAVLVSSNNDFGAGGLGVAAGATLVLSASNNGTGLVTNAGTIVLAHSNALGTTNRLIRFSGASSVLDFETDGGDTLESMTMGTGTTPTIISGRATPGAGIAHHITTQSLANGAGGGTISVIAGTNVTSGTARIVFDHFGMGSGTAGATTLFNPTTAAVTIGSARKENNNVSQVVGLGGTNADNYVTGAIENGPPISGTNSISVTKSDLSTWYLLGTNTYTGPTTVSGGSLFINGNNSGATGAVSVSAATLGGSGSIGGSVALSSGTITPGADATNIGTLTILGSLSVDVASAAVFRLGGNGVNDAISAAGGSILFGTIEVELAPSYTPASGDTFDLFAGAISGSPTLSLPTLSGGNTWVTNDFLTRGVLTITNTNTAPTNAYTVWLTNYPGVGIYTNMADDPDGDGFDNGKEFSFDGNPTAGTGALFKTAKVGTNVVFSFVANNSAFPTNYVVQSSANVTNAASWTNNTAVTGTITNAADQSGVLLTNEYTRKEFTVPVSGTEYFRVRAVMP